MAKKTAIKEPQAGFINPFAIAEKKEPAKPAKAAKGNILALPILWETNTQTMTTECRRVHDALATFVKAKADIDTAKGKSDMAVGLVKPVVLKMYSQLWAKGQAIPETPISVSNEAGVTATYVVQDRTGTILFSEQQQIALAEIIGQEAVNNHLKTDKTYSFNSETLAQEGVMEKVGKAIMSCGLTEEQAAAIFECKTETKLKDGFVPKLSELCKHDPVAVENAIEALGTCLTIYLQA